VPLLDINGFAGPIDLLVKRVFDLIAATLVIVVSSPLLLANFIIGARFKQKEILGAGGQPVTVFVFNGGLGFMKNIPLYLSVFAATLSIVGSEIIVFKPGKFYPTYKPGLTGLVQVKGNEKRQPLTQQEKDYYNLYYIKNQSIITDLQIIAKSIF